MAKNPTPVEAVEEQLIALLKADHKMFITAVANVLEKHGSDCDLENYDELDDAVHALRFSMQPYDLLEDDEDDD